MIYIVISSVILMLVISITLVMCIKRYKDIKVYVNDLTPDSILVDSDDNRLYVRSVYRKHLSWMLDYSECNRVFIKDTINSIKLTNNFINQYKVISDK